MTDNPFDPIPAPAGLFRGLINATACLAATAAVVFALVEVFAQ